LFALVTVIHRHRPQRLPIPIFKDFRRGKARQGKASILVFFLSLIEYIDNLHIFSQLVSPQAFVAAPAAAQLSRWPYRFPSLNFLYVPHCLVSLNTH
jgi:hypothetical protein